MADSTALDHVAGYVTGMLETAFPGHRCPKCSNEKFYLLNPSGPKLPPGPLTFQEWPIIKIACSRCGYMEEYLTGIMKDTLEKNDLTPIQMNEYD